MAKTATRNGWLPNQHGAWAMLAVPSLLAVADRSLSFAPLVSSLLIIAFWWCGYLWFFAASGWLKAAHKKRARYEQAIVTYGVAAGIIGLGALWANGPGLLLWAVLFIPLLSTAFWLISHRRERALLSGLVTVAAATALPLVCAAPSLLSVRWAEVSGAAWCSLMCFGYFFGTVLYVKTMIRERGERSWYLASVAYHAAWTAATCAAIPLAGWFWPVFFALTTVRAAVVPKVASLAAKRVGIGELGFSLALLIGGWSWLALTG